MPSRTFRTALAAIAIAAAALGSAAAAGAAPMGPCEEVVYVGVCEPVGGEQRSPDQQGMGEVIIPGVGNNIQAVG